MNCICDNCKQEIQIEAKDIKLKSIDELMVNVTYFECSRCNKKYIVSCVDKYILKEQRRYLKLGRGNGKYEATIKALKNMKIHSDRLKYKVISLL
ncbi:Uncharacterised protein [uncultured Clostridium sp.]|nr:Uncharacterised protein [uncultured Clostridium sp.]